MASDLVGQRVTYCGYSSMRTIKVLAQNWPCSAAGSWHNNKRFRALCSVSACGNSPPAPHLGDKRGVVPL